jgi:outer membrane protein OmpA-like peptidoglycan-associated protein
MSGIVELDGLPTRPRLKHVDKIKPEDSSATPSPDEKSRNSSFGARVDNDGAFALASASLRQALQDMPEIAEISKQVMIEETKQGLNIEIVDQNGSSMFPDASKEPYERTRRLVQRLSASLKTLPYRVSVSGHTAATTQPRKPGYGPWELSADRANSVRSLCFPMTPSSRPIAASRLRCCARRQRFRSTSSLEFAELFCTQQIGLCAVVFGPGVYKTRPLYVAMQPKPASAP